MTIRSKSMLNAAKDQACTNCGTRDGTVVAAHYQGMRSQSFGKGKGVKPHDLVVADLCAKCHSDFDSGQASYVRDKLLRRIDLSERFLSCVVKTVIRRAEQGVLTAKDIKLS